MMSFLLSILLTIGGFLGAMFVFDVAFKKDTIGWLKSKANWAREKVSSWINSAGKAARETFARVIRFDRKPVADETAETDGGEDEGRDNPEPMAAPASA